MLVRCLCTTSHIVRVTHAPTVVPFVDTNYVAMRWHALSSALILSRSPRACVCLLLSPHPATHMPWDGLATHGDLAVPRLAC